MEALLFYGDSFFFALCGDASFKPFPLDMVVIQMEAPYTVALKLDMDSRMGLRIVVGE
jgi:hypothetical protein